MLTATNRKETQIELTNEQAKLVHELLDIEIDALSVDPINAPDIRNLVAIKSRLLEGLTYNGKIYFKLTRRQIGKITSYMRIPNDPYLIPAEIQ